MTGINESHLASAKLAAQFMGQANLIYEPPDAFSALAEAFSALVFRVDGITMATIHLDTHHCLVIHTENTTLYELPERMSSARVIRAITTGAPALDRITAIRNEVQ